MLKTHTSFYAVVISYLKPPHTTPNRKLPQASHLKCQCHVLTLFTIADCHFFSRLSRLAIFERVGFP